METTEFKIDYYCSKCKTKVEPKWEKQEKAQVGSCPKCHQELARKAKWA
jgi:DNA-directed RNA polymerase subunit RPC12/RpoP